MNEQKRLEYRQLVDQLFETMHVMIDTRRGIQEERMPTINVAVRCLHRLLTDQLFIAEKLAKGGVIDDFLALQSLIFDEHTYTDFAAAERAEVEAGRVQAPEPAIQG